MKAAGERPKRAEFEPAAGGEVTWRDEKKRGEMKVGGSTPGCRDQMCEMKTGI